MVVDDWPLVRLGITQALRGLDMRVVAETGKAEEGLRLALAHAPSLLLLGGYRDVSTGEAARRAAALPSRPKVLVLLDQVTRDQITSFLALGVHALLVRSATPADLAGAVARVRDGERVVAPALVSLLVGAMGRAGDARDPAGGALPSVDGPLTRRELEVLVRLAEGRSNREIADALFVTSATVKTHLAHIYAKLGVTGRQEAMARAVALGLLG